MSDYTRKIILESGEEYYGYGFGADQEKVKIVQDADAIYREEIDKGIHSRRIDYGRFDHYLQSTNHSFVQFRIRS